MFEDIIVDKSFKRIVKEWDKGNKTCPSCNSINFIPGLLISHLDGNTTQKFVCEVCETEWEVLFSEDMSVMKITIL
jgi:transposase-like protein